MYIDTKLKDTWIVKFEDEKKTEKSQVQLELYMYK